MPPRELVPDEARAAGAEDAVEQPRRAAPGSPGGRRARARARRRRRRGSRSRSRGSARSAAGAGARRCGATTCGRAGRPAGARRRAPAPRLATVAAALGPNAVSEQRDDARRRRRAVSRRSGGAGVRRAAGLAAHVERARRPGRHRADRNGRLSWLQRGRRRDFVTAEAGVAADFVPEFVTVEREVAVLGERPVPFAGETARTRRGTIARMADAARRRPPRIQIPRWIQLVGLPLAPALAWVVAGAVASRGVPVPRRGADRAAARPDRARRSGAVRIPRGFSVAIVYSTFAAVVLVVVGRDLGDRRRRPDEDGRGPDRRLLYERERTDRRDGRRARRRPAPALARHAPARSDPDRGAGHATSSTSSGARRREVHARR